MEQTPESAPESAPESVPNAFAKETIPIPWDSLILRVLARYEALIARKTKGDCP